MDMEVQGDGGGHNNSAHRALLISTCDGTGACDFIAKSRQQLPIVIFNVRYMQSRSCRFIGKPAAYAVVQIGACCVARFSLLYFVMLRRLLSRLHRLLFR